MFHLTEMKHNTIHFLHLTHLRSQNTSLSTVNAYIRRMEVTQFMNKLTTTSLFIENVILHIITLGQVKVYCNC